MLETSVAEDWIPLGVQAQPDLTCGGADRVRPDRRNFAGPLCEELDEPRGESQPILIKIIGH
jgi:hypothetical protein